jgi:tetratricopeptide (TPR) repeat protein
MRRSAIAIIVLTALAVSCAPKVAPPAAPGAARYPDFVYPAPPDRVGDARVRERLQEGWGRMQAGDLRGAEAAFAQLVRQEPAFYPASVGLGYALLAQGKTKEALARFDGAVAQAPRYGPALAGRGEALLAARDRDAAIGAFEAALAADAGMGDLRRRIDALKLDRFQDRLAAAKRAFDAGQLDEARDAYKAAIALSPDTAFLYRDLGLVDLRRKDLPEAERNLRKAAAMDPSDVNALTGLADVLDAQGDLDGAAQALERAYALGPTDALKQRIGRLRERALTSALPPEYAAIPARAQATRADLAALIGVRLRTALSAAKSRPSAVATDVRAHWAARWIVEVMRAGVMDAFPNHTFQPDAVVRRSDLAQAVSRVLALAGAAPSRAERNRVAMADVGAGHLSFDAISAAVASGVLSLDAGNFRPSRAVTGQEAVDAVRRLEAIALRGRNESR